MLEIQNLHIGYGHKVIQKNLNLTANDGELICLLGKNGCGKSTLLRTVAGLQKSLDGNILLHNKNLEKLSVQERATLLSLVLTDVFDVENLTVHDLVAMGRFPYTDWSGLLNFEDEAIVSEVLQQVNMTHKAQNYVHEISDGEKQRAIIAKALAQDTPLVLLDEPTSFLDLPNRIEIMQLLKQLSAKTKKTFILSTHELDLALQMADKIWLMNDNGVEVGIPEDLMLSGKFQSIFGSDAFVFDPSDGHCNIKHSMQNGVQAVHIVGNTLSTIWLKHALNRCGIPVSNEGKNIIEITPTNQFIVNKKWQADTIEQALSKIISV